MLERLAVDWPLKVLALMIAFGIWAAVTGEKRIVKNFTVPLEVLLPGPHLAKGRRAQRHLRVVDVEEAV